MLELTIARGDSVTPGLPDADDPEVEVWRQDDGGVYAYGFTLDGQHWMHLPRIGSFRFGSNAEGVMAVADPSARVELVLDAYYRCVLPMALHARGMEVLHASAVLMDHRVVALCAVSGTGKSTIAYGLSQRGYQVWADDALALEISGPCIRSAPLPFEVRLREASTSLFHEDLNGSQVRSSLDGGKRVEMQPMPLAALCVLNRAPGGGDSLAVETARFSPAEAFPAVLSHAWYFSLKDVERKRRMVQHYLAVAARLPVLEVRFQAEPDKLVAILDRIEEAVYTALSNSP